MKLPRFFYIITQSHNVTSFGIISEQYNSEFVTLSTMVLIWTPNKSGVKRLNTLGHLDQYMAQPGGIVKQSYCETVLVTILFNSN